MTTLNKKIKTFTISEMLVVLVISSIIVAITLVVLNLVQSQIRSMQSIYKTTTKIQVIERALWKDLNTYRVSFNDNTKELKCISELDSVFYSFYENGIIRNKDTTKVKIGDATFYLDGTKVNSGNIDAIALEFSQGTVNKKRFIFKNKDATHYMQ